MSELNEETAVYLLDYLANCEPYMIEGDEFEFMGETEDGRDGVYSDSIINIASTVTAHVKDLAHKNKRLRIENEQLKARVARLEDACTHVIDSVKFKKKASDYEITMADTLHYAFNETPKQSLNAIRADAVEKAYEEVDTKIRANLSVLIDQDEKRIANRWAVDAQRLFHHVLVARLRNSEVE